MSNNAQLLTRSIELMNFFKENGSRGCLGAYDNICIFLCHAGRQNNQNADFWNSLVDYCMVMEEDKIEVGHTISSSSRDCRKTSRSRAPASRC